MLVCILATHVIFATNRCAAGADESDHWHHSRISLHDVELASLVFHVFFCAYVSIALKVCADSCPKTD